MHMTEKRGSGSSLPIWLRNVTLEGFSPLGQNHDADVCIVGAGIAGLTCGYLLSLNGIDTLILEDGKVGGGETSRTTGHLTYALDDRYYELERIFGTEGSAMAAQSHRAAVNFVEELVAKENIACNYDRVDAFLFAPPGQRGILEKELEAVKRAGISDAEMVAKAPLESFNTGPCIRFPNQAEFSPLPYINKLSELIFRHGGKIFTDTHVEKFETDSSHEEFKNVVITSKGNKIRAKYVIIATNAPVYGRLAIHTKQAGYRTYVIAGKIPKGYIPKGLYYDTLDPYHYIRVEPASEDEDFLIIGGEDHKTGQEQHPEKCYQKLEQWSRERFPKLGEIEFKWSGQIMEPVDCLAFIGRHPSDESIFIATGDSGNGLTHGTIAGILITDLIRGIENPWKKIYDPSRKTVNTLADYIQENTNTFLQYADWVILNDKNSLDKLPNDSGTIITKGFGQGKMAIYRDEKGQLHTLSAVCPHLGGIVHWNSAEKSWDCPCHASRFDRYGKVLHGPAISNLEKEDLPSQ
jgi:glycine/D-amino acid oxidase-like deaminating enzyme/nitrite reductase/ring-hydroxylating ferredoxin subunit